LRWYGHVLRKEDNDWVKKCMDYKVEGTRPRGRPKKTWREIVEKDCRARGLNTEDAMDRSRRRKQIGMIVDRDECSGWMFLLVPAHPGCPGQVPQSRKTVVCVCVCVFNEVQINIHEYVQQSASVNCIQCHMVKVNKLTEISYQLA